VYSDGAHEFSFYVRNSPANEIASPVDLVGEHVAQVESSRFTALVVTAESRAAAVDIARFASHQLAQHL
jgi:hypothetical protein